MLQRVIAASIAAALAASLTACGDDSSDKAKEAATSAKQKVSQAAESAKQKASQAVTTVTGGRVLVVMSDFKFAPSELTVDAGTLRVTARNVGKQQHEFVLLRTDKAPDAIPLEGDKASEADSVGEISEQNPGDSATHSFKLTPGKYVFICNVDGHYKLGMRGSLDVK